MKRWPNRLLLALTVGAALVAALLLRFGTEDYSRYLKGRRASLARVHVEGTTEGTESETSWIRLENATGLTVECGVRVPKGPTERHPGIVLLGGRDAGRGSVANARNVPRLVIVSPDYRLDWNGSLDPWEVARTLPEMRRGLFDVVPAAILAADYLRGRPDVDPTRIVLVGFSFGALFVPCIAAHDHRFAAAVMVDGGGGLGSLIRQNLAPWEDPWTCRAAGLLGGWLLRPLEPLRYADQIAPMPLLMVAGTGDARIPRESVESLFARAREPKRIVWFEAGHVDPRHPELLDRIIPLLDRELRALNIL